METEAREQGDCKEMIEALVNISVESWRFAKVFNRLLSKLDAGESARYANQLRYFIKKVEESIGSAELKMVNIENHPYDAGIAASALNIDEFEADDDLVVDQMIEPIIMGRDGIVRSGSVVLRKAEK